MTSGQGLLDSLIEKANNDFEPDFNIRMTLGAVKQFEEIPFGKIVLYGKYSDEKGIVISLVKGW